MIGLDYAINIKDGSFGAISEAKAKTEGLDNAVRHTNEGFGKMGEMLGELAKMATAVFAVDKIIEFSKQSFEVFEKIEQGEAQLTAGIKSTAGIAGRSLEDLVDTAKKFTETTLFNEEDTMQAEKLILTFTNIRGAIFDETIPAVQNMATRLGGDGPADLKGASIQLGKALQDPVKGIAALHRVGVDFSDAQKAMIQTMVEHGNVVGAQKLILQEINTEFGGSAEAARKAKGSIGDLSMETHALMGDLGELISEGLQPLAHALVEGIHWAKAHKGELKAIGMMALVVGGAFVTYKLAIMAIELPMTIMTAAQWALNVAMDANPIGLIITGVGLLIAGFVLLVQHSDKVKAGFNGLIEIGKELGFIFKDIKEEFAAIFTLDFSRLSKALEANRRHEAEFYKNGGFSGAFNRGYDASIAESEAEKAKDKPGNANELLHPKGSKDNPTGKGYSVGGKGDGDGESTKVSGGSSVRNVQVTIGKLVERLEVHTTNIQGANAGDIKRQLTELLVSVVHDSELALGSQ